MSLPLGVPRRAFSYDDALEDTAPMTPPPADLCANVLWKQPVIPERKYQELSKIEEGDANMNAPVITPSSSTESVNKVPVVKAKATHVIMNSLITSKNSNGVRAHEHALAWGWFSQGSSTSITGPDFAMEAGGDRLPSERWSFFGPKAIQKSTNDPGGFTIQSYKGAQKPSPMELMRAQATRMPEDPVTFKPPKMDIPVTEGRKQSPRSHNIKPRDLNVLTPTGF
ncbi:hypothetical protein llap_13352 [Limosa lapponica baueri]|uniref:Putative monooxygenase p33MONOX n=1 Tax=Limosa lapponica baueri TaxID=1758121 RepID=A0A2I0TRC5_LIMLA|nr:hypothetical protein llap_13352 [Limosa lapponica baueri]